MSPSQRVQRKLKRIRYLEYQQKNQQVETIKDLFGKPNPKIRLQLYSIMKDKKEYKNQLKMMKKLFIGGK